MVVGLIALRVVVAALLVAGPWIQDRDDLAGWDVARFQEIADAGGRAWRDHQVEYPAGSVLVIEALAVGDVVTSHRLLVLLLLAVDLSVTAGLHRWSGRRAALVWLGLGTLLLPTSYLRLDLLAAALALLALEAARRDRHVLAATAAVAGAHVKLWPVLLVVVWLGTARWRTAALAAGLGLLTALGWLAWAGPGAPGQVIGYRGATGWHVESVAGVVSGWWSDGGVAVLEQGAFRWGHAATGARLLLLGGLAVVLLVVARRVERGAQTEALAALTLVAALLVASPLLSPQYLCWLFPFAAVVGVDGPVGRLPVALTAIATGLTALVLAIAGPPGVDEPWPQAALGVRNLMLVSLVGVGLARLRSIRRWPPPPAVPGADAPSGIEVGSGPGGSSSR